MWKYLVILVTLPLPAFAGAWVQEAGRSLISTQITLYSTNEFFDIEGNTTSQSRFHKEELNVYGEYGWNNTLTFGTNLFLNRASQNGSTNIGIADSELFARLLVWKDNHSVLSLQPLIKLPSLYEQSGSPRGGTDSTDIELSVLFGHSFRLLSETDYVDARIGYRTRNNGLNAQWRTDIAYGITLTDTLQIISAMRVITATQLEAETFSNNGELDYDLSKAELSALYHLNDGQAVQFSYFAHIAGRQTGSGQGISVGFTQRF